MVRMLSGYLRRTAIRCIPGIKGQSLPRRCQPIFQLGHARSLHEETSKLTDPEPVPTESEPAEPQAHDIPQSSSSITPDPSDKWTTYNKNFVNLQRIRPTPAFGYVAGQEVVIYGFIGNRRDVSSNLSFCEITNAYDFGPQNHVQIVSSWKDNGSLQQVAHLDLLSIPHFSPVIVTGTLQKPPKTTVAPGKPQRWDLKLRTIHCLNPFPKDIIVSKDAVWPPTQRHLQLRFDPLLRDRLKLRSALRNVISKHLVSKSFIEVETPLLFKSTPEGAREFLVPTRRQGYAYALPQSPQQYKQMLMASGVTRYYQFAKCFRDEDHRADRQPEFTQLDIEMAFSDSWDVIKLVSSIVERIFLHLHERWSPVEVNGIQHPTYVGPEESKKKRKVRDEDREDSDLPGVWDGLKRYPKLEFKDFTRMSYSRAMQHYGTDKPDLRIAAPYVTGIRGTSNLKVSEDFVRQITGLKYPFVECFKVRLDASPRKAREFIRDFMDSLPNLTTVKLSPGCRPAVFIYDSSKPLNGLAALGHECAQEFEAFAESEESKFHGCKDGDIIIFHARKRALLHGSSTDLGRLRSAIYYSAVEQGLLPKDNSFKPVWIREFPLFTPNEDTGDPGQGGTAGFSSTHHPFTAPLSPADFFSAKDQPFQAKGDNYDLVINGVEVGGGSRRIHVAKHQEWILRDVLKMTDEGMAQFSHLMEALRAGCPPHAGFAFGFDRLMAVICDVPSVRDVIAFPKNNKGEDQMVGSPAKITPEQRKTYHLFQDSESELESESGPEPELEPKLESKLEQDLESKLEYKPELELELEPEPELDSQWGESQLTESQPESTPESKSGSVPATYLE
ncbi:tRNA synthetases class II-domain-containing protein [Daldinia caldariorum]|uniref:tRNA synthetases class II-domain-containing protein n=1 Tax=Daldinia caldariorum TaxID=326644 RepID=UPI002007E270|nr:tRNA synthetases class II-domain-containing protein [Daldinia caldariorum]KAI1464300.1 tRNA synthetases class II-domain-containing protein [Daldinia caldariorum]